MIDDKALHRVRKVMDLAGGHEAFFGAMYRALDEMQMAWTQDAGSTGRVLVAHLAVEHFLTQHLEKMNPNLGSLDDARLSFAQKVDLMGDSILAVQLKPGLRTLNKVRNRLGHNLNAKVSEKDRNEFLTVLAFKAFRNEGARRSQQTLSAEPLIVLEEFARFSATVLQPVPFAHLWKEAFETTVASGEYEDGQQD